VLKWNDEKNISRARVGIIELQCILKPQGWQVHVGAYITSHLIRVFYKDLDDAKFAAVELAISHCERMLDVLEYERDNYER
jgi:hypothetical protein